jgi:hypothetical protein
MSFLEREINRKVSLHTGHNIHRGYGVYQHSVIIVFGWAYITLCGGSLRSTWSEGEDGTTEEEKGSNEGAKQH